MSCRKQSIDKSRTFHGVSLAPAEAAGSALPDPDALGASALDACVAVPAALGAEPLVGSGSFWHPATLATSARIVHDARDTVSLERASVARPDTSRASTRAPPRGPCL